MKTLKVKNLIYNKETLLPCSACLFVRFSDSMKLECLESSSNRLFPLRE